MSSENEAHELDSRARRLDRRITCGFAAPRRRGRRAAARDHAAGRLDAADLLRRTEKARTAVLRRREPRQRPLLRRTLAVRQADSAEAADRRRGGSLL